MIAKIGKFNATFFYKLFCDRQYKNEFYKILFNVVSPATNVFFLLQFLQVGLLK
jgi:hypothetical protein